MQQSRATGAPAPVPVRRPVRAEPSNLSLVSLSSTSTSRTAVEWVDDQQSETHWQTGTQSLNQTPNRDKPLPPVIEDMEMLRSRIGGLAGQGPSGNNLKNNNIGREDLSKGSWLEDDSYIGGRSSTLATLDDPFGEQNLSVVVFFFFAKSVLPLRDRLCFSFWKCFFENL